ncbi:MAG: GtrA family protein [Prevotella sp.]|nr:GtrA family protein [Prevotella sp.]
MEKERVGEIIRFAVVGVVATIIQAAVYWLLVGWINYAIANTTAYLVSFLFNYVASTRYTFRVRSTAKRGAGFAFSHLVNYLLQTLILTAAIACGIDKRWALLPMFAICVPVNFVLVRFFLKGRHQNNQGTPNTQSTPRTQNHR